MRRVFYARDNKIKRRGREGNILSSLRERTGSAAERKC